MNELGQPTPSSPPPPPNRICEVKVQGLEEAPRKAADLDELIAWRPGGEDKVSGMYRTSTLSRP